MTNNRVFAGDAQEDEFTSAIEKRTAQIPSSAFLALALGSMAASLTLNMMGKKHAALFVGQWAAPFLILGEYNKLVKQHGSDASSKRYAA